jgi:hypothetical protein
MCEVEKKALAMVLITKMLWEDTDQGAGYWKAIFHRLGGSFSYNNITAALHDLGITSPETLRLYDSDPYRLLWSNFKKYLSNEEMLALRSALIAQKKES